jgi:hypothetical protein
MLMNSKISIDFSATSVYLSSIATSLVALASASIISTISAYTLGSLAHPPLPWPLLRSHLVKKCVYTNVKVVAFYVIVTGVDVLDRFSLYTCITANRAVQ